MSEYRKELDGLVSEYYDGKDSKVIEYKIRSLRQDIQFISRELINLEEQIDKEPGRRVVYQTGEEPQKEIVYKTDQELRREDVYQKAKKNYEAAIGKNFMGILASVLIFISLIFFATLIYPYLNDAIKMAVMYGISFAFMITGILKVRKNSDSRLYQSVAGCGLGAVYISLLVSRIWFEVLNDMELYVLIAVWAVFICFLSKFHLIIFQITGQLGICISVLFGIGLCISRQDMGKYLFLVVFFIVTSTLFLMFHYNKEYEKNAINHIFNTISMIILSAGLMSDGMYDSDSYLCSIAKVMLLVYIAVYLVSGYIAFETKKEVNIIFSVVNILYTVAGFLLFWDLSGEGLISSIIIILIAAMLFAANEFKLKNRKDIGKLIFNVVLLAAIFITCITTEAIHSTVSLTIFIIPLLYLGFAKEDFSYKIFALVYAGLYLINGDMNPLLHLILGMAVTAFVNGLMVWKKEQYHSCIKNTSYVFLHLYIFKYFIDIYLAEGGIRFETLCLLILLIHSIINIAAMKSIYSRNWFSGEKESGIKFITCFINAACMILSLICIENMDNQFYHILCIFIAIALFVANTGNLMAGNHKMAAGFYIGIKLTVLVSVVTYSFNAADYVISIVLLMVSAASITAGFIFRYKSFRLYGLILVMLSTVKLIMVDIAYDNTIERAISFFICGILCFAISILYNKLDKKFLH